jgi:hypothetical protein
MTYLYTALLCKRQLNFPKSLKIPARTSIKCFVSFIINDSPEESSDLLRIYSGSKDFH